MFSSLTVTLGLLLVAAASGQTNQPLTETTRPAPQTTHTGGTLDAPAPASTTYSTPFRTTIEKLPGSCCKQKDADGNCVDISGSDLYYDQTPDGSNTWCGIDECGCGYVSTCLDGETNCGYNSPEDDYPCICAADCYLHPDRCCDDFQAVCNIAAPAPSVTGANPAPAPKTTLSTRGATQRTTTAAPTSTAVNVDTTSTASAGSTSPFNGTDNTGDAEQQTVIIASVTVVVVVVVVVLVVLTVRVIKQKQAESKPLFAASTTNTDVQTPAGPSDVELADSTRSTGYESTRSSKRSKKKKKKKTPKASASSDVGAESPSPAKSTKSKKSKRSRRSPGRGKKSPKTPQVGSAQHAHDDVFASPTHHNFEL